MHELRITQDIVTLVSERAQGARVTAVTLEIGQFSPLMTDAIRFCFDIVCQGTPLEGATLHIQEIPGTGSCQTCGATFRMEELYHACPCGSREITLLNGQELTIKEMVIH